MTNRTVSSVLFSPSLSFKSVGIIVTSEACFIFVFFDITFVSLYSNQMHSSTDI